MRFKNGGGKYVGDLLRGCKIFKEDPFNFNMQAAALFSEQNGALRGLMMKLSAVAIINSQKKVAEA